jgi:hypothetical protein
MDVITLVLTAGIEICLLLKFFAEKELNTRQDRVNVVKKRIIESHGVIHLTGLQWDMEAEHKRNR